MPSTSSVAAPPSGAPTDGGIEQTLASFEAATSALLGKRRLLRRVDSKFLMPEEDVDSLLATLPGHYALLHSAGAPVATYRTLYFDTKEFRCFHDHRRGRRPRFKVRVRHYDDRKLSYLEVKTKRGPRVTSKARLPKVYDDNELDRSDREFLSENTGLAGDTLCPVLWTNFSRLTLLSLVGPERVTIDFGLQFESGDQSVAMSGVSIVEVKQASYCLRTPIMHELRTRHIRSSSASKYCAALHETHKPTPNNRLLPSLRAMAQLRT